MKPVGICLTVAANFAAVSLSHAQQDSAAKIAPVVVTVTRGGSQSILWTPFGLTVSRPDSARPGQRHTSIDETLALIPGVTVSNRNNPSQDPRISIRGFGSRSAFGVRGVRVLRDGMPLTLPDGQTPLDYMSLESVGRVEVMRGAASALYGNASGGVIDIRSAAPSTNPVSASLHQWVGGNSFERTALDASGTRGRVFYQGDIAHSRSDGTRNHSRQRATTGFARGGIDLGATGLAFTMLGLVNPLAENAGALTADQLRADPRQADGQSVQRNARKAVRQFQLGVSASRTWSGGDASVSAFGGARSLDNPLTFAIVDVGRHSYGASARLSQSLSLAGVANRFSAGTDVQTQSDLRRNFATCADTIPLKSPTVSCPSITSERGIVTLDQRELVSSAGIYASDELTLSARAALTAGVRADNVRFEVRDRLVTSANSNDSGKRTMGAISPVAGVVFLLTPEQSIYANAAGAFETPTATELGNHPDGSAGINQDLNPQKSITTEIGAKGFLGSQARYDAALFKTNVRDELVPFEIPNSNGRRYFRNAGKTIRRGAEAGVEIARGPVSFMAAYSYSSFHFDSYAIGGVFYDGKTIPGVPRHHWQTAMKLSDKLGFALLETESASSDLLDDANAARGPGYTVANFRIGASKFPRAPRLSVSAGVQNVFDRHYAASVAVNAARGKYFEPAASRNLYVGLTISSGN